MFCLMYCLGYHCGLFCLKWWMAICGLTSFNVVLDIDAVKAPPRASHMKSKVRYDMIGQQYYNYYVTGNFFPNSHALFSYLEIT